MPDPTNEELDAWAAEWLGWIRHVGYAGKIWWHDPKLPLVTAVHDWTPTKEGSEHQAMMVVERIEQDGWRWEGSGDKDHSRFEFIRVQPLARGLATDRTTGRAIVLAAWRAVKGETG